eukprot:TRINITY_DN5567_c0_g1_i15.p1 TRINITY_DN5567_c0_g1~~TRINITY_DN5567_c0_g1_i15.p1  ORF type:complete len:351 (+),score=7.72 TRINITY_DN5567_c0_g1_i15:64-1053(+)
MATIYWLSILLNFVLFIFLVFLFQYKSINHHKLEFFQLPKLMGQNLIQDDKIVENGCTNSSDIKVLVCTIFRDVESIDIQEWVEYHKWIGIDHFYLREHQTTNGQDYLKDYINQGIVTYDWTGMNRSESPQKVLSQECIDNYRSQFDFIVFIDSDEYIVMQQPGECFNSFLENYTDYGALGINWVQMGTSGNVKRPPGGILMNYVNCDLNQTTIFNKHIKSVVNTKYVKEVLNIHFYSMNDGKFTVNEHFKFVPRHETPWGASWEFVALYHYQTKSQQDIQKRKNRRLGPNGLNSYIADQSLDNRATQFCFNAQRVALKCCSKFYVRNK